MTAFARKVLGGLPDPTVAGTANNYSIAAGVHHRLRQGRRQGRPPGRRRRCRCSAATAAATSTPFDQPPHPAAVGRRRQRRHLRAQQAVRRSAPPGRRAARRCSKCASAGRGRRRARTRRRSAPPARSTQFGICRACRPTRASPAACRRSVITGYSDLGRQATNPQWQYPTVYNPKINYTWTTGAHSFKTGYEFQHIDTEVQDVNPLYGRDTYNGQFTRPAGAAANNLYNLADFMLGLRAQYALSNVLVAEPAPATCTSPTCRTTCASTTS